MDKTLPPTGVTDKAQRDFLKRFRAHLARPGCQVVVIFTWPEDGQQYIQADSYSVANRSEAIGLLESGKLSILRVLPVSRKHEAGNDKPA